MLTLRRAQDRGHSNAGWLDSHHSFSFADYHDPKHMGFRTLRVLNDDRVSAGSGFGTHSHRDMEIISYVLSGALEHKDSLGTGSTIRPGDVQRMSAGTGVRHSEWNHSKSEAVHFLQIWIVPSERGIAPSYEQKPFAPSTLDDRLQLIASPDGRDGSVTVHQDVNIFCSRLSEGHQIEQPLAAERFAWLQVARGGVLVNGTPLAEGDGAYTSGADTPRLTLHAMQGSEILLFDLS
jgi:redox-sensitive bicupin YhaK (pirin superfamily)